MKVALPQTRTLLGVALVALVTAATYANTLQNEFVYDDQVVVLGDSRIRDLANWTSVIFDPRFLKTLTFMIDYRIWGLDPFGYHLTNIIVHLLATIALYTLLRVITGGERIALLAGLLFAVHPIHTEVVANVANRKDALATFFVLLALVLYIKRKASPWCPVLSWISYVAAVASKEVVGAALLPLMVLYDFGYRPQEDRTQRTQTVYAYSPYVLLSLCGVVWLVAVKPADHAALSLFALPQAGHFTAVLRAFSTYLGLLVWPVGLNADHLMSISESVWAPSSMMAIGVMMLVLAVAVNSRTASRETSLGLWWMVLAWLPISNLVPVTAYYVAERYFYLPSVGFCLVVAALVERLWVGSPSIPSSRFRRGMVVAVVSGMVLFYSWSAYQRNLDWRSDLTLWSKTVTQSPLSANAHFALGHAYGVRGRDDLAVQSVQESIRLAPRFSEPHSFLGSFYLKRGHAVLAINEFQEAVRLKPSADTHHNLGVAYAKVGNLLLAEQQFRHTVELDPNLAVGHYQLAVALEHMARLEEAQFHYRAALTLAESDNRALAEIVQQRLGKLSVAARSAVEGNPQ